MASYLRPRRGKKATAIAQLTASAPLKRGEVFFEVPDGGTGTGAGRIKMGDGSTAYESLPYFLEPFDPDSATVGFTNSTAAESDPYTTNATHANAIVPSANLKTIFTNLKQLLLNYNSQFTKLNNDLTGVNSKFNNYFPLKGGDITGDLTVKRNDPYLCLLNTGGGNNKLGFHWYGTESGKNTLGIYDLKNKVHLLTIEQATKNAIFSGGIYTNANIKAGGTCHVYAGDKIHMWTDNEGGNLEISAPDSCGNTWQVDAHDGNLRFYTYNSDGVYKDITFRRADGIILANISGSSASCTGNAATATTAATATLATMAKFLGEGVNKYNTGNGANPIYISNGLPTRSNSTVGSADTPVYLNSGTITSTGKKFSDYLPLGGGTIKGKVIVEGNQHAMNFRALDNNDAFIVSGSSSNIVRLCGNQIQCNNYGVSANVAIYASAFSQTSSRRYKENIEDLTLEDAMKILDLRPVTYDYINKANGVNCQGLIAEEVDQVMKYPVIYNDEGQPDGLDYSKFVPSLIKLVQYQEKRIEELEKTVESLASKIG